MNSIRSLLGVVLASLLVCLMTSWVMWLHSKRTVQSLTIIMVIGDIDNYLHSLKVLNGKTMIDTSDPDIKDLRDSLELDLATSSLLLANILEESKRSDDFDAAKRVIGSLKKYRYSNKNEIVRGALEAVGKM